MAIISKKKIKDARNLFELISGKLGNVVIRQYDFGTVVSNLPKRTKAKRTPLQKARRKLMMVAVRSAKTVLANPKKKAAYSRKLKGRRNVYQAVVSDYLRMSDEERKVLLAWIMKE